MRIEVFTRAEARLKASPGREIIPSMIKLFRIKWFLHAFGDAHLIATMALIHRSTERKRLL
jgi:hypothetical protein